MKNRTLILTTLIAVAFLFTSCQKAKETEGKKEAQTQQEEVKQQRTILEVKENKKEKLYEFKDNPLSAEEQKKFKGVFGQGSMNEKKAIQNLKILLKSSHNTILYYQDPVYGDERGRLEKYSDDFCTAIQRLANLKSKEGYNLILEVIKEKVTDPSIKPSIRGCAAGAISWYGELKNGKWYGDKRAIPVLKELINDRDPEVRLQAAGTLLSLGEADIALPVLDKLAEAGIHQSTFALDKLFAPEEIKEDGQKRIVVSHTKLWDEKGKEILIKALNYSNDEVKAFAAARLAQMGVEKKLVEDTAIKILERLKNKKKKDYKTEEEWHSNGRAGHNASVALEEVKSIKGMKVMKELIENNDDSLLRGKVKEALENIQQNNKGRQ